MAKVVWTEQAYEDLETIFTYISHDSGQYARLLAEKVLLAIRRLQTFPESGRIVPECNQRHIREIIVGTYRVIYQIKAERVTILAIRHGATRIHFKGMT